MGSFPHKFCCERRRNMPGSSKKGSSITRCCHRYLKAKEAGKSSETGKIFWIDWKKKEIVSLGLCTIFLCHLRIIRVNRKSAWSSSSKKSQVVFEPPKGDRFFVAFAAIFRQHVNKAGIFGML